MHNADSSKPISKGLSLSVFNLLIDWKIHGWVGSVFENWVTPNSGLIAFVTKKTSCYFKNRRLEKVYKDTDYKNSGSKDIDNASSNKREDSNKQSNAQDEKSTEKEGIAKEEERLNQSLVSH